MKIKNNKNAWCEPLLAYMIAYILVLTCQIIDIKIKSMMVINILQDVTLLD